MAHTGALKPVDLRCEYGTHPIGLGERKPRLSWSLAGEGRGLRQQAYRILVASSRELIEQNRGDLWDSGRVVSDESIHIPYEGKPLTSRMECHWKVLVWSYGSDTYVESEPAVWEMGLLEADDWHAQWIGLRTDFPEPAPDLTSNRWMWAPSDGNTPKDGPQKAYFRRTIAIPKGQGVVRAWLLIHADSLFRQYTNGLETARHTFYVGRMQWVDLTYLVQPGENTLAIEVSKAAAPAGLIGKLLVELASGEQITVDIDETWKAAATAEEGWNRPDFDDSRWRHAVAIADYGDAPWGEQAVQPKPAPAPHLRKAFQIAKPVVKARLYATALGLYHLRLNGEPVSDAHFAPGWTDYHRRVMVSTFDVTDKVRSGENVLGVVLGDGWYAGHVGMFGRHLYGPYPLGCLAQLELEYEDGTVERLVTDAAWQGAAGPIVASDMLMGETYDARLEMAGWDRPGFATDERWRNVEQIEPYAGELVAQVDPDIRTTLRLRPVARTSPEPGVYIFDLGQNMVGRVRLTIRGAEAGRCITLRHGEMLLSDGSLYTLNLRSARQMDTYICKGGEEEVFEPLFTFHGFRYVEVRGYPGEPPLDAVEGLVIHSDTPITGEFECSHPLVNRLQRNIVWGQRGNFLSVPTDCPQRDERLGWTGDAQVFIRTACFNADTAAFFTKWMVDVTDAQREDGAFTDIAPAPALGGGTAAWGDAGVIVPWTIYLCYGDTRIIERNYEAMKGWIEYLKANSDDLIRPAAGYGDWLSVDADTPKDVIATAFFAYSTKLLAKMARVIGREQDAEELDELFARIRAAFNRRFVAEDGTIHGNTQTAYLLGLRMDLLSPEHRKAAVRHLVRDIQSRGDRLSTGFVGCSYLLPELTDGGELELAYKLLTSTEYPSWGYSIMQGATTMWERWDSYKEGGTFQDVGMNSFNHYAYGSVGEWMYRYLAGIDTSPEGPGYKQIVIRPRPGGEIEWARARYDSLRGPIAVDWRIEGDAFTLKVAIPANTTARVYLPTDAVASITESGVPAVESEGITLLGVQEDAGGAFTLFEVGSGEYTFRSPYRQ